MLRIIRNDSNNYVNLQAPTCLSLIPGSLRKCQVYRSFSHQTKLSSHPTNKSDGYILVSS